MKPTPIELEMPMGKDINGAEHREPYKAYDIDEVDSILAKKDAEIAKLKDENKRLKAQMPRYKQFEEREKFLKTLVDEYEGYVYDWKGKAFIATPYINIFIKGILRALWLARAERANEHYHRYHGRFLPDIKLTDIPEYNKWVKVEKLCRAKAEEYK